jgi:hypothetical protein
LFWVSTLKSTTRSQKETLLTLTETGSTGTSLIPFWQKRPVHRCFHQPPGGGGVFVRTGRKSSHPSVGGRPAGVQRAESTRVGRRAPHPVRMLLSPLSADGYFSSSRDN